MTLRAIHHTRAGFLMYLVGCASVATETTPKAIHNDEHLANETTTGRYKWVRFTFRGGQYQVANKGEVPNVSQRITDAFATEDQVPPGESFVATPSTLLGDLTWRRRSLLRNIAKGFLGFGVRVSSDVDGDNEMLTEEVGFHYRTPAPDVQGSPALRQWDRQKHGPQTIEVVFSDRFRTRSKHPNDAEMGTTGNREYRDLEWKEHVGSGSYRNYLTGLGSPTVFVKDSPHTVVTFHEIGHAVGLVHTTGGIMATDGGAGYAFDLFVPRTGVDEGRTHIAQRPIDFLAPAFGIRRHPLLLSQAQKVAIESNPAIDSRVSGTSLPLHCQIHPVELESGTHYFLEAQSWEYLSEKHKAHNHNPAPINGGTLSADPGVHHIAWSKGTSHSPPPGEIAFSCEGSVLTATYPQPVHESQSTDCSHLAPFSHCTVSQAGRQAGRRHEGRCSTSPSSPTASPQRQ